MRLEMCKVVYPLLSLQINCWFLGTTRQVAFSYRIFARMRIIQFQFLSTLHLTLYIINKKHLHSTCYADVMQMLPFPSRLYTLHLTPSGFATTHYHIKICVDGGFSPRLYTLHFPPLPGRGWGRLFSHWLSSARRWFAESPTFLFVHCLEYHSSTLRL